MFINGLERKEINVFDAMKENSKGQHSDRNTVLRYWGIVYLLGLLECRALGNALSPRKINTDW